ncbi:hypothetical protein M378DRAFT_19215 [Amanita muscaria Koide BX008]|uniref:Uncharacterized protein n=1 Tax=Amanita muscaria (strain Koide BX008) TaxID=946122 RepID=A0A0C2WBY6_AMAMK|nr:hypothetical protein M378DRAFT_19215 [Amanita muscaria Koide BX008]
MLTHGDTEVVRQNDYCSVCINKEGDPVTGNHKPIVERRREESVNASRGDPKRTKTGEYPAQVPRYIYILTNPIP